MNRTRLKNYAPKARLEFIRAVTDRARKIGLTAGSREPVKVSGDVAIILGQQFPRVVAEQRHRLDERIERQGFGAVMEEVAYTWFNRFMAIRYMELHGYLDHGFRVLSHPEGRERPEILDQAEHVDLPGLDRAKVIELKLDGTQDETLYKMLLLAQCHALHAAMPFLFEKIDDQTELLLPDNLLASDSVIRKMVTEIAEEDWEQIEVIGWLYQFYISDKKDEVIGKVVKSEDIPAATQLFTPNWIVKYMVQNSLGRKWLATYLYSPLKAKMEYYIEPAEQTPEVQAQLDAITPTDLNPEELTLIDPACGSGHILCEAYDLFKEIYLERGYRLRDIPRLILEKNIYGLDIDDRAAQMAGFALMMKARADDRRVLDNPPYLNVLALQASKGLEASEIAKALLVKETFELVPNAALFPETMPQLVLAAESVPAVDSQDVLAIMELFTDAKTIGSLITVPQKIAVRLPILKTVLNASLQNPNILARQAAEDLYPFVVQAELLVRQFDFTVMNPPYMGSKGMNAELKKYTNNQYPHSKTDLFAMFIERGFIFAKFNGSNALVTMQSWMFLSSYETLRKELLENKTFQSMVHLGARAFPEISGEVVQVTTFVVDNQYIPNYLPVFIRAIDGDNEDKARIVRDGLGRYDNIVQDEFSIISGSPIAYWATKNVLSAFAEFERFDLVAAPRAGMSTGDNTIFQRRWTEVSMERIGFGCQSIEEAAKTKYRWFPCNSGGEFRKWYGNNDIIVDWECDGKAIRNFTDHRGNIRSAVRNPSFYFKRGVTWTKLTSGSFAARLKEYGFIFDDTGRCAFPDEEALVEPILALQCSKVTSHFLGFLNPSMTFTSGDVARIPVLLSILNAIDVSVVRDIISIAKQDWDAYETSWDFQHSPLFNGADTVDTAFATWESYCAGQRKRMTILEEENNRLFIDAYGLQSELSPDVPDEQITLARADREQDMRRLVSYAIGCVMGRYSLSEPGLIYAHRGNQGFDTNRYTIFSADEDGILPLTDNDWFGIGDSANQITEFLSVAWPTASLSENLVFLADSLNPKADETPIDTIRRYLCVGFFKDHLQTYKRRPIYWLFSSGKERAFQALVYLHRYNEGTLARMRMDYVVPLQSRMSARIDQLREDIAASVTTADRKKREKEREKLLRQLEELRIFDEKLRHYADMRISLDLDDGVKVNYGKFGDLLAEVKAVTGGSDE